MFSAKSSLAALSWSNVSRTSASWMTSPLTTAAACWRVSKPHPPSSDTAPMAAMPTTATRLVGRADQAFTDFLLWRMRLTSYGAPTADLADPDDALAAEPAEAM